MDKAFDHSEVRTEFLYVYLKNINCILQGVNVSITSVELCVSYIYIYIALNEFRWRCKLRWIYKLPVILYMNHTIRRMW